MGEGRDDLSRGAGGAKPGCWCYERAEKCGRGRWLNEGLHPAHYI